MAKGIKTGGRQKGTPNKVTAVIRDAFREAFEAHGGVKALVKWAKGNETEFYKLCGRLIPSEVNLAGDPERPVVVKFGGRYKPTNGHG